MEAGMKPILKAHIALNVASIEHSVAFYQKMLGIAPLKVRPGYAKFDVQDPPLNLSLNEARTSAKGGTLSHLGLQVASTEDVLAVRSRWSTAGLVPRDEMQTSCCYALQDKAWVADPDGNEWEVFAVLGDVEQPAASACCDDSCCGKSETLVSLGS
jgi:catechol 2,3-dioxygenase-like lactoylglutathione lyase family enzyme